MPPRRLKRAATTVLRLSVRGALERASCLDLANAVPPDELLRHTNHQLYLHKLRVGTVMRGRVGQHHLHMRRKRLTREDAARLCKGGEYVVAEVETDALLATLPYWQQVVAAGFEHEATLNPRPTSCTPAERCTPDCLRG